MLRKTGLYFLVIVFGIVCLTPGSADALGIRLKNGRVLQGEIMDYDEDGFQFKLWTTGGVVHIAWYNLTSQEITRVNNLLNVKPVTEKLKGYRIYTNQNIAFEGFPLENTDEKLVLKNIEETDTFLKKNILKMEPIELDLLAVYTKDELYQKKYERYDLTKGLNNHKLAQYCRDVLNEYGLAEKHFLEASKLDPSLKSQVEKALLEQEKMSLNWEIQKINTLLRKESIAEARVLLEETKENFDLTNSEIKEILDEVAARIDGAEKGLKEERRKEINRKIVTDWHRVIKSLLKRTAADKRLTFSDACQYVASILRKELVFKLAKDYKISEIEVENYWEERDLETVPKKTAGYGDGSYWAGYRLKRPARSDGQAWATYRQKAREIGEAKMRAAGQNRLITIDAWWNRAGTTKRTKWLEAYFAERQMKIIEKREENCTKCQGKGVIGSARDLCDRCIGGTLEVTIEYH